MFFGNVDDVYLSILFVVDEFGIIIIVFINIIIVFNIYIILCFWVLE